MNVMIIGVDGAEYTLIDKLPELMNFRQEEYGFHSIPHLSTSILWRSFLTGKEPEDFSLPLWKRGVNKVLRRFFGRNLFSVKWKSKTMLELAEPSLGLEIPTYTEGKVCANRVVLDMKKYSPTELERIVLKEFWDCVRKLKERISKRSYRLIVVHFGVLDLYQHFWDAYEDKILNAYFMIDDVISEVKRIFEGMVLVVSDHGLINGIHTPYGFYSVSEKIGLKEKIPDLSFTDYYQVVKCLLNDEPLPQKSVSFHTADWKLIKTLNILNKARAMKRLVLITDGTLESLVLKDVMKRYSIEFGESDRKKRFVLNVTGKKWSDGGENYMAYHFQSDEVNPILHWTNKDVYDYALKFGLIVPSGYVVSEEITKEMILDRLRRMGYFDNS